jgi:hypothetical protein
MVAASAATSRNRDLGAESAVHDLVRSENGESVGLRAQHGNRGRVSGTRERRDRERAPAKRKRLARGLGPRPGWVERSQRIDRRDVRSRLRKEHVLFECVVVGLRAGAARVLREREESE